MLPQVCTLRTSVAWAVAGAASGHSQLTSAVTPSLCFSLGKTKTIKHSVISAKPLPEHSPHLYHYLHNSVLQRAYKKPGKWILLPTWTTDVVPELCSLQPLLSSTSKETSMKPPQVHVTPWSSKQLSSHLGTPLAQPHLVLEDSEMWNDASKQTWMKEGRKSWILQWINAYIPIYSEVLFLWIPVWSTVSIDVWIQIWGNGWLHTLYFL